VQPSAEKVLSRLRLPLSPLLRARSARTYLVGSVGSLRGGDRCRSVSPLRVRLREWPKLVTAVAGKEIAGPSSG
jgi:hypothetical protein